MKTSPTQRSLKLLRERGYLVAITERWNQYAHVRQDLFGFIDLLAVRGDYVLAVQTTSGSNASARLEKINQTPAALLWLSDHRGIVVHAWRKVGERGKRKTWECREIPVTTITPTETQPPTTNP